LASIYILRELMDRIVPGSGGKIRPSEYFDMIGASGPNGLMALLFTRFVGQNSQGWVPVPNPDCSR
jgi:hypothetical protein